MTLDDVIEAVLVDVPLKMPDDGKAQQYETANRTPQHENPHEARIVGTVGVEDLQQCQKTEPAHSQAQKQQAPALDGTEFVATSALEYALPVREEVSHRTAQTQLPKRRHCRDARRGDSQ